MVSASCGEKGSARAKIASFLITVRFASRQTIMQLSVPRRASHQVLESAEGID